MIDVGVSMRKEVFEHKIRDGKKERNRYCFWKFRRIPEGVEVGSRLWVAQGGRWIGYFQIGGLAMGRGVGGYVPNEVRFYSESFVPVPDAGPRPPFMGYTKKVPSRSDSAEFLDANLTGKFPWEIGA